jgi:hypothetical protein
MIPVQGTPGMRPATAQPGRGPGRTGEGRASARSAAERKDVATVKSLGNSLILRGILTIVAGILALAWPSSCMARPPGCGVWELVSGIELRQISKTEPEQSRKTPH